MRLIVPAGLTDLPVMSDAEKEAAVAEMPGALPLGAMAGSDREMPLCVLEDGSPAPDA